MCPSLPGTAGANNFPANVNLDLSQVNAYNDACNGSAITALLYEQFNHHLKTYNAVDFDDLIMLSGLLFRENPEVLERWQRGQAHLREMLAE